MSLPKKQKLNGDITSHQFLENSDKKMLGDIPEKLRESILPFFEKENEQLNEKFFEIFIKKEEYMQTFLQVYNELIAHVTRKINESATADTFFVTRKYATFHIFRDLDLWKNTFPAAYAGIKAFVSEMNESGYSARIKGITPVTSESDDDDIWYIGGESLIIECKF